MICYLAHPIDAPGERVHELTAMVDYCRRELHKVTGLVTYDPQTAWIVNERVGLDPRLQRTNMMALNVADFCLAVLPQWSSSIGVPLEIEYAARYKKQVYVIREGMSFALASLGSTVHCFDTPEAAIREIRHVWAVDLEAAIAPVDPWVWSFPEPKVIVQPADDLEPERPLLTRSHDDDAGFDMYYIGSQPLIMNPGDIKNVWAGIRVQWPEGIWGLVIGRSSSFKRGLLVNISVIDPGYRGDMFALVSNIKGSTEIIQPGERIAQIIPMPLLADGIIPVIGTVDAGTRGEKGFGSSGR